MISYSEQNAPAGVAADIWDKIEDKLYRVDRVVSFSPDKIPVSNANGIAPVVFGDQIVSECNSRATSQLISTINFNHNATISLSVNTRTSDPALGTQFVEATPEYESLDEIEFNGGDKSKHSTVTFKINCSRASANEGYGLNFDPGELRATNINLSLTTSNTVFTTPRPDRRCEVGYMRVRLETNQPGLVSFKLFKMENGVISNEDVIIGTHHDNGKYVGVHERNLTVSETASYQFKARDLVNDTFNHETSWKTLQLDCEGTEIGGLSLDTSPDNPLNPTVAKWDGDIIIADGNVREGEFPRPAQVFFNVESEESGNFNYHISCSNGRSFQGSVNSFQSGSGKWKAFGAHNFNQGRPMALQCRLREVKANGAKKSIDKATFRFAGAPVNPDLQGSIGGLTSEGRTTHGATSGSKKIGIKTLPPKPRIEVAVCKGGKIRNNKCFCPAGSKRKKISRFEYLCKGRITAESAPKKLVCVGGKVRGGKCACGPNKLRKKLTTRKFQCLAIAKPTKPTNSIAGTTKPKKRKLVCAGGKVRSGKCACGKNKLVRKVAKRKFQCIAIAKPKKKKQALRVNPEPKKKKAKRTNPAKKKRKLALICKGGKIRNNKCGCPKGKLRKKQGKRKFLCFRPAG